MQKHKEPDARNEQLKRMIEKSKKIAKRKKAALAQSRKYYSKIKDA